MAAPLRSLCSTGRTHKIYVFRKCKCTNIQICVNILLTISAFFSLRYSVCLVVQLYTLVITKWIALMVYISPVFPLVPIVNVIIVIHELC